MNIRQEIEKYSKDEDKPILLGLFSKYHWSSQWSFVASCYFEGKYPTSRRIWVPKSEGKILYKYLIQQEK